MAQPQPLPQPPPPPQPNVSKTKQLYSAISISLQQSCAAYFLHVLPILRHGSSSSSSSSQNPAESSAHNASVPDVLWAQRDQPALEDIK